MQDSYHFGNDKSLYYNNKLICSPLALSSYKEGLEVIFLDPDGFPHIYFIDHMDLYKRKSRHVKTETKLLYSGMKILNFSALWRFFKYFYFELEEGKHHDKYYKSFPLVTIDKELMEHLGKEAFRTRTSFCKLVRDKLTETYKEVNECQT